ncbi:glutamate--tRNA ligase [Sulfitobacter pseudonitzschiae]|uniref:Glutamate--tRNA ligase n=1 Tax=Pseudosulfitobacter pseudonitzschiae TaxID=1402135 RepID=A0A9Q2RZ44_9RHOB|nr:glutamate--tRNA ligase [Pseudosulfitobacter pseudonitzschiae]MBM2291204.1 glutamate--tRNA ligase [Pseudosulfitobacter pseudonitzschiae]MBM2296122.1 glutamate--tRNA ligase [Pseudosulfitobacter pseudonitzschiae]MBM2301035.1 glutamate--tRNA ligase [Pseudosulfitobacter pseudonitzschiae]MBM2310819.1 glutamate--tRNA ligase [Pseudosulfitobacter pseudonitzschiae]MBM2315732.1 glutamate--tRNA ligase [Pseudosulfitobacter pseudonitzschiae]
MTTQVVTRFAPSPTGYLHIGGARTALFNWLYARGRGGKFLLRIEDTDRARSTPEATAAILQGMAWLGLDHDGEVISQFERAPRHAEVALELLAQGKAYKCFSTQDEIAAFREAAKAEGKSTLFRSPWRDAEASSHPDAPYVIRIKAPLEGKTVIRDEVQGDVTIGNEQLDDMVLLRSDGTPVYMLAVVVDDHDMGVTHVIRGDDHLNNAARQMMIYNAMGWDVPVWAHIPLIHGADGKKLSKRHGALGAQEYQGMGYAAAGMRNYLSRLGWSHGDDEFFTDAQALEWFDLSGIGKSPARFDTKKLENLSGQHIAVSDDAALQHELAEFLKVTGAPALNDAQNALLAKAMPFLKERAKTFYELLDKAAFALTSRPVQVDEKAEKALTVENRTLLAQLTPHLQNDSWDRDSLEAKLNDFAEQNDTKFGKLAGPLRAALAGRAVTPSVFDMMLVLGPDETRARINDVAA